MAGLFFLLLHREDKETTMLRTILFLIAFPMTAFAVSSPEEEAFHRNYVSIVGSTSVAPYAKAVGEKISKTKKIPMPLVQPTGTNGGIKLFCEGLSAESPDIVMASRYMKQKEREECLAHGITDIVELKIGYDAIILGQSKKAPLLEMSRKEVRKALFKWVPDPSGTIVLNATKTWNNVNSTFPNTPITVYGPPSSSGSYDALVDMLSELECKEPPWIPAEGRTESPSDLTRKCHALREDGVYIQDRENDDGLVTRLDTSGQIAVFNYKLVTDHNKSVRAIPIDGVEPDLYSISNKVYPGTRPLLVYIKKASLDTKGLREFIAELMSENALGQKGYFTTLGLVPMASDEYALHREEVKALGITPNPLSRSLPSPAVSKTSSSSVSKGTASKGAKNH